MMPFWSAASIPYFAFIIAAALITRDVRPAARVLAVGSSLLGLALAALAAFTTVFWLRSVVLPPMVLLIGYRASGFLWRGPMFDLESKLTAADHALGVPALVRATPQWLAEILELSYAGVYPMIPIALVLHLAYSPAPDADWFWSVVLVTDYVCFAMLPFIQTRPPRALEASDPWRSRLRAMNMRIVEHASIGMNTVPSGHAAEALACALLVLDAPAAIVVFMFAAAAGVSAGAVFGRYHYAVDIIAGWGVALAVWWSFR